MLCTAPATTTDSSCGLIGAVKNDSRMKFCLVAVVRNVSTGTAGRVRTGGVRENDNAFDVAGSVARIFSAVRHARNVRSDVRTTSGAEWRGRSAEIACSAGSPASACTREATAVLAEARATVKTRRRRARVRVRGPRR